MKITYLIATLDRGGSEQQMAQLAAGLDRSRFSPRVLCLTRSGPVQQVLDDASVPVRVIGKTRKVDIGAFVRLFADMIRNRPDILHTWLFTSNLHGRIAGTMAFVPHLVASERSTDPWKSRWHRLADEALLPVTSAIVANSKAVAASLAAHGIPAGRIRIIPNSVDTERFQPRDSREARKALDLPQDGPYMGYVGRLAFEKRPEVFVDAAIAAVGAVPKARAVLFGTGPMEAELKARAAPLGDRITFYGDCPKVELAHAALDVLVLTSAWEGFPNVVLEAMASARPVVAVRMPATEELIESGASGVVVHDSVQAIANAAVSLLKEPARASAMGAAAREKALRLYSVREMVAAYEQLYVEIAGSREKR